MSTVHWTNAAGGDWNVASNWSTGTVPGAGDDAVIDAAGTYTVTVDVAEAAHSLTLADAGATVQVNNALTIGSTLGLTAGAFDLTTAGTLVGGTIIGSGLVLQGGTLSGVTRDGTLDLSANTAKATITNAITLTSAAGTGPGSVVLTGYKSGLYFAGTETLDNAAVSIGNRYAYVPLSESGGTLTLGPNLTITQTGTYAALTVAAGATVVSSGTITAGMSGGHFQIGGSGSFANHGTIGVSNGDALVVGQGVAFSNQGTVSLASGAALHLKDNLTTAALGTVTNSGGTVFIEGTLDNTGAVLATGAGGLGTVVLTGTGTETGTVVDGTITGSAVEFLGLTTLSGVNYQGTLDLSSANIHLWVRNGITLSGAGGAGRATVLLTGYGSYVDLFGSATLDNASISIGGTQAARAPTIKSPAGSTLSLGANLAITQSGGFANLYTSGYLINRGTIAATRGSEFSIYGRYFSGYAQPSFTNMGTISVANDVLRIGGVSFSNQGTITLSSGATLFLNTNFNASNLGTLVNSGGTLGIGGTFNNTANYFHTGPSGFGAVQLFGGTILRGTVGGAGMLGSGTLSGVTYRGPLNLSADNTSIGITNGITLTGTNGSGPGQVLLTGTRTSLGFYGTETFDNAVVSIGATAATYFPGVGGSTLSESGAAGTLTLGPHLTISQVGRFATIKPGGFSSTIVNEGTINAGLNDGQFNIATGYFRNDGQINVSNADTLTAFSVVTKSIAATEISGSGTIALASGGDLVATKIDAGQTIDFLDNTGRLDIGTNRQTGVFTTTGTVAGPIVNFQPGDVLDFAAIGTATAYTYGGGKLSLYLNGTVANQVTLSTLSASPIFAIGPDGLGGTAVTMVDSAPQDFDGDSVSEVLLHNVNSGQFIDWVMNGSTITTAPNLTFNGSPVALDPSWSVQGTGDFNGDSHTDILLQQSSNGSFMDWAMSGSSVYTAQPVTFNGATVGIDSSWWSPGLGDFNGDGKTDILLRHTDGTFMDWQMNGSTITSAQPLTFNGATVDPDFSWSVATLGDFDGGGTTDILLRNSSTGSLVDWVMNGSTITAANNLTFGGAPVGIDGSWSVLGSGDFNGDGKSDILLENNAGAFVDWTMNGATIVSAADVTFQGAAVAVDPSWTFADIGDYNGDGKADILLRNSNGSFVEWTMNGPTIATAGSVTFNGSPVMIDSSWHS